MSVECQLSGMGDKMCLVAEVKSPGSLTEGQSTRLSSSQLRSLKERCRFI